MEVDSVDDLEVMCRKFELGLVDWAMVKSALWQSESPCDYPRGSGWY